MAVLARTVYELLFLFMLMLGLGVTVKLDHFREHLRRPRGILIGLLSQFVVMPPLAYCLSAVLKLRPIHRVALVLTGCCPGGARRPRAKPGRRRFAGGSSRGGATPHPRPAPRQRQQPARAG